MQKVIGNIKKCEIKVLVAVLAIMMVIPIGITVTGAESTENPVTQSIIQEKSFYEGNSQIYLAGYGFDVKNGPENLPSVLCIDEYRPAIDGYYIVQFNNAVDQQWTAEIEALGGLIGGYVPYNAFIVKMSQEVKSEVKDLPFVQYVGIYQPAYKMTSQMSGQLQLKNHMVAEEAIHFNVDKDLRQQASVIGEGNLKQVDIILHEDENVEDVAALIKSMGGNIMAVAGNANLVRAEVSCEGIQALAFVNEVEFIQDYYPNELTMQYANGIEQSLNSAVRPIWDAGLHGENQIVATSDSGLDTDHNVFRDPSWGGASDWTGASPSHRKVIRYQQWGTADNVDVTDPDNSYHGTHTASQAVGNGAYVGDGNANRYGMAYQAKLSFHDVGTAENTLGGIPADLKQLHQMAYDDGARLSSHSWGVPVTYDSDDDGNKDSRTFKEGVYTVDAENTDLFMWKNKDYQVFFSAGNDRTESVFDGGVYNCTVTPPATGKNLISVGAHSANTGWDDIQSYSSWGPTLGILGTTTNGRLKPDLCSSAPATAATSDGNRNGAADTGYTSMSGTSTSGPIAMGSGTLVRQYYTEGFYPMGTATPANAMTSPSAALIKATMINSARDPGAAGIVPTPGDHPYILNGHSMDYPNNDVGWGMLNLDDALYFSGDARELELDDNQFGLLTGQFREYKFTVESGQPLEITTVWTDYPGTQKDYGVLVNDLDLTVIDTDGKIFYGNIYGTTSRESDSTISEIIGHDHLNNVECVLVTNPVQGEWTVFVNATNTPVGPQPYALVMTGDFDDGYGWIKVDKHLYTGSDTINVEVKENDLSGNLNVTVVSSSGDSETFAINEVGTNARIFQGSINTNILTPVMDDGFLSIEDDGWISARYHDGTPDHWSYANATTDVSGPAISNVFAHDISNTAATVYWKTDVPAKSQVYYGTTNALGSQTLIDNDMVLHHNVTITGLNDFQDYYFDVESESIGGVTTRDNNGGDSYMFKTQNMGDILLVFGGIDGFDEYENVRTDWEEALDLYSWSYNIWITHASGNPSLAVLQSYKAIIWQVGHETYPAFDDLQRPLVKNYLDNGGRLWVVSHDLMWGMDDQANSGYDSPETEAFIRGQMKANWVADESTFSALNGVAADPISGTYTGGVSYSPFRSGGAGDTVANINAGGATTTVWNNNGASPGTSGNRWISSSNNGSAGIGVWGGTPSRFVGSFHEWSDIVNKVERENILDLTIQWLIGDDHPDVTVVANNGGITWSGTQIISWNVSGTVISQDIHISKDGGQSWIVEATGLGAGATSHSWNTSLIVGNPVYPNGDNYKIKVISYGATLQSADISDSTFAIDNGASGDYQGPVIRSGSIQVTPTPIGQGHTLHITAIADDTIKGNSNISQVEFYIDGVLKGNMIPEDTFDSPLEGAKIDYLVSNETVGAHNIIVIAMDTAGNWGGNETINFYVIKGPPTITINTPASSDIIGGSSYNITYTANDQNYNNSDIDIKIEYSPNGGGSWVTLEDGTDNNAGYLLWDISSLADGVNYLIRISATNDINQTEVVISEPFSVDNTQDDQWFFQMETTGSFKDLDMKPVSTGISQESLFLDSVGQFEIGAWQTPSTYDGAFDGDWTFNVYGHVAAIPVSLDAHLYAIIKNGTGSTIATSSLDNENVGSYTSSHLFTWTETLSGTISNSNVRVEIWLDIATASGGSSQSTYVPVNITFSTSYWDVDEMPPEGANLNTEFTTINEPQVSTSDDLRFSTIDPGLNDEIFVWNKIAYSGDPDTINNIEMTFEGQGNRATDFQIWAYTGTWAQVGTAIYCGADTDGTITRSIISGCADYIQEGVLNWGVYQTDNSDLIRIDFMETVISVISPPTTFLLDYDSSDAQSNVQPPPISSGPDGYGISLTGFSTGDWSFISFPYSTIGNIETILDDSVLGDGGTTWDVAKWYDPQDTTDPWKTYRAGASTNDLATIDNTMGVWVHLTANGGDQKLTTSVASDYSGSNVAISLYTGWNLVSYPSATARLASTTLPGQADMVAYYNSGATYLVTEALPTAVTFSEGNAYWVHVTSDAFWFVTS